MLLEDIAKFDPRKYALELQQALLDSPYGEHLDVTLERMSYMDAFDGTHVRLSPETQHLEVIVLRVNDDWDAKRDEPLGSNGIRAMIVSNGQYYVTNHGDNIYGPYKANSDFLILDKILNSFVVLPDENSLQNVYMKKFAAKCVYEEVC